MSGTVLFVCMVIIKYIMNMAWGYAAMIYNIAIPRSFI